MSRARGLLRKGVGATNLVARAMNVQYCTVHTLVNMYFFWQSLTFSSLLRCSPA